MPTGSIRKQKDDQYKSQARELVAKMSREEKVYQMVHHASELNRLGIPAYNWWNEALHGVAVAGTATVFPQAIGLAATFSPELIRKIADVISTEGRAKHETAVAHGDRDIFKGLTFWSPNINIFRDPRWGRGQETYGEDPFLTAELGKEFIRGLQGEDPEHLKAAACVKHYAVHSGPEAIRHEFDARVSPKDLWETYLYAFEECVIEAKVEAVMGAYNRTNGDACCAHPYLLKTVLRDMWGFDGHVTSDCWAIKDINEGHGITKSLPESAALAVKNGCDINCGEAFYQLLAALTDGIIEESQLDASLVRLMTARMRLGLLGEPAKNYQYPFTVVDCAEHRALNFEAAKRALVLVKNDGLLPVSREKVKTIAVIGPNADSRDALTGNYNGMPNDYSTLLRGITDEATPGTRILYSVGCHLYKKAINVMSQPTGDRRAEAMACAENADLVVLCLGLDATIEGEEGNTLAEYDGNGDKPHIGLPGQQNALLEAVLSVGKPTVVVLVSGSALVAPAADEKANAMIQAFYPGAYGGKAVAQMIFGDFSPSGRLPVTFYHSTEELPDFKDYEMTGKRTYKYMPGEALYPFGFGLSYTKFEYTNIKAAQIKSGEAAGRNKPMVHVTATVKNAGSRAGWETAELYLTLEGVANQPRWQLRGVSSVWLEPGESKELSFELLEKHLWAVLDDGSRKVLSGQYRIYVGGSQPDSRSVALLGRAPVSTTIKL